MPNQPVEPTPHKAGGTLGTFGTKRKQEDF